MADLSRLNRKFPQKRAFITGAGSGIGLAFAHLLSKNGWTIGLADSNEEGLSAAANMVEAAGGSHFCYKLDVSDYDAFKEAINNFVLKCGGIDIGINNAGIGCGGYIHELPIETFRKVIDVNLIGVVNGCHLFVPIMKKQGSGHILNVSSAAAFIAPPRMSAYNLTKGAVLALSETLCGELFESGVRVTVLMPGYVRTNIGRDALGSVQDNRRARAFVGQSHLSADQVALETLLKMQAGKLYAVLPAEARFLWRFKRFFPDRFWRFMNKRVNRLISKVDQRIKGENS